MLTGAEGSRPIERVRHRPDDLPSALDAFEALWAGLEGARPALFLDYDGTLAPIVDDPMAAHLPDRQRAALARVARVCPVAVVSGRDLEDVRGFAGLQQLASAGSHGFEAVGPGGEALPNERGHPFLPALDRAERALRDQLAAIEGVFVERKRYAIAVHFRRAGAEAGPLVEAAIEAARQREPSLRRGGGKMIVELRPDIEWDKGRAMHWLLEALPGFEGAAPLYLGDDLTDEDAFEALPARGIGIVVHGGDHESAASYALASTEEVSTFLERLAERLEGARQGA